MVEYTIYKGDGIDDTMMILGGIKMNKTELVAAVAEQAGLSKKDAEAAIKAFADVVSSALKEVLGRLRFPRGKPGTEGTPRRKSPCRSPPARALSLNRAKR